MTPHHQQPLLSAPHQIHSHYAQHPAAAYLLNQMTQSNGDHVNGAFYEANGQEPSDQKPDADQGPGSRTHGKTMRKFNGHLKQDSEFYFDSGG